MPRLSLPELPYSLKCLPPPPHLWTYWWHERVHPVYEIWHLMGIQQYLHLGERPMEGCLYHSNGTIEPTIMFFRFCNAPPTFQAFMNHIFTDMLREKWLKIYMDDLGIHTKDDVALHHECTYQMGTSMPLRTWIVNQTLQMHIWCPSHGVPWHDHWPWGDQDGWKEIGSHKGVETPHFGQGNPVIHQVCELLQEIHSRLLQHLLLPLTCSLVKGNPGPGFDFNGRLLNASNISSPLHQSSKSQTWLAPFPSWRMPRY